jgi:hypothetical protein
MIQVGDIIRKTDKNKDKGKDEDQDQDNKGQENKVNNKWKSICKRWMIDNYNTTMRKNNS